MTKDDELIDAIKADWRTAKLSPRERAMCEYAETITRDATQISPATLDGLRAHGYDDVAILQMATIAAWFNYINRMADALGVGR